MVGLDRDRSGTGGGGDAAARTVMLLTSNRAFAYRGVARGARASAVRAAFPKRRRVATVGSTRVYATSKKSPVVLGVARGAVRFVAVYDRTRLTSRELAAYVRRSA